MLERTLLYVGRPTERSIRTYTFVGVDAMQSYAFPIILSFPFRRPLIECSERTCDFSLSWLAACAGCYILGPVIVRRYTLLHFSTYQPPDIVSLN